MISGATLNSLQVELLKRGLGHLLYAGTGNNSRPGREMCIIFRILRFRPFQVQTTLKE